MRWSDGWVWEWTIEKGRSRPWPVRVMEVQRPFLLSGNDYLYPIRVGKRF